MDKNKEKQIKRIRRHARIRAKVFGTAAVPRLSVFRSNTSVFAQIIDDENGKTILSVSSKEIKKSVAKNENKTKDAEEVGKVLAQKALEKKISKVVFDKGGYKYHGRVKALADGARASGLIF